MEVVFIMLSLAGLALVLNMSQREEKKYKAEIAECRARLICQLEKNQRSCT